VQTEDGHYQTPKRVLVPYVENTLYSTNKYSFIRRVHKLYISYFIAHNGDDEPRELAGVATGFYMPARRSCDR